MSTRLKPIENPSNPLMKIAYVFSKKQVGKVISPLKVIYSRLPLTFGIWMNKMLSMEKKLPLSEELRLLIRIHIAQVNTCGFCIDIAKAQAIQQFKNTEKFFHINEFETSPLFTGDEKLALRYATEINDKKLQDATFEQAKKVFTEQQLVGIAWMVTSENLYNIMNLAFNIESDGLCQVKKEASK